MRRIGWITLAYTVVAGLTLVAVAGLSLLMSSCKKDSPTAPNPLPQATVFLASGSAVTDRVGEFRNALGPPNGATPGDRMTGRREVAWDAAATAPFDNR